ncbi:hypothetical protein BD779DRAFT_440779 [Infundibulicybe gibba]|nr:hypothetical protein BD779DRAFT_440779 [Infundibulicybe gibba]
MFPSMPLDVVFEILSFLHPSDLIALTHTNKMFRRTVHPQGSVWRQSRIAHQVPDCYPGVSEARWAFLLFGGNHCHCCGAMNVRKVDFGLCRRVCTRCNRQNIINAREFGSAFSQVDELVLSLVPQTNIGPSPYFDSTSLQQARLYRSSKNGFWKADIQRVVEEWHVHQRNIRLGGGNAEEEYILYLGQRMRDVDRISQHAGECVKWAISCANERNRELNKTRRKRCKAIREGLIALGFERRDINPVMRLSIVRTPIPLTSTTWVQIRSQLVPLVETQRDSRIARASAFIQQMQMLWKSRDVQEVKWPWDIADVQEAMPLASANVQKMQWPWDSADVQGTAPWPNADAQKMQTLWDSADAQEITTPWASTSTREQRIPRDARELRITIFQEVYAAYLFQLLPLNFWEPARLPTVDDLLELDPFKNIIESDSSVIVDSSSFTAAIHNLRLPELIAEWRNSFDHDVNQAHVHSQSEVDLPV